jgi:hypothetical protein
MKRKCHGLSLPRKAKKLMKNKKLTSDYAKNVVYHLTPKDIEDAFVAGWDEAIKHVAEHILKCGCKVKINKGKWYGEDLVNMLKGELLDSLSEYIKIEESDENENMVNISATISIFDENN